MGYGAVTCLALARTAMITHHLLVGVVRGGDGVARPSVIGLSLGWQLASLMGCLLLLLLLEEMMLSSLEVITRVMRPLLLLLMLLFRACVKLGRQNKVVLESISAKACRRIGHTNATTTTKGSCSCCNNLRFGDLSGCEITSHDRCWLPHMVLRFNLWVFRDDVHESRRCLRPLIVHHGLMMLGG